MLSSAPKTWLSCRGWPGEIERDLVRQSLLSRLGWLVSAGFLVSACACLALWFAWASVGCLAQSCVGWTMRPSDCELDVPAAPVGTDNWTIEAREGEERVGVGGGWCEQPDVAHPPARLSLARLLVCCLLSQWLPTERSTPTRPSMSMSARVTRKRAKEQQEAHMAAAAVAAAASSSSSAPPSFARPIPVPASSSSHKRKGQQPAKKKPKRDHNEAAAEGEETEDHDVTMAAASSSSSPAPFDPYLPRDLLRIVFQYAPPSQLSRYVPVCPWITSDGALCRSVMRYYAAQAPIKITEHTPSYHEQTLAGSFINNYPFHLSQTQRKSKQFAEESWELSATHFLCNPEDPEVSCCWKTVSG
jgi:hypothetical protein